jgi:LacI family transcriptional regulator
MAVTIRDVAERAGVCPATVFRYLNGAHLREKNRVKVAQAIQELGFKADVSAIAVIVPALTNLFAMTIVTGIERLVVQAGYNSIICDFANEYHALLDRLKFFKNRAISGIILFPLTQDNKRELHAIIHLLEAYRADHIPVVVVDDVLTEFETDAVLVDNAHASFRAIEHLIHQNHRQIAILNGRQNSYVSQERLRGALEALQTYKVPIEERWLIWGDFRTKGGYAAVTALYQTSPHPTALYSTNYNMTIGAIMALNDLQIRIPEDLSVIGFDHFSGLDVVRPALTVIEQPLDEIGKTAGELMLKRIKGDYTDFPQIVKLKTRMVIRDSVQKLAE